MSSLQTMCTRYRLNCQKKYNLAVVAVEMFAVPCAIFCNQSRFFFHLHGATRNVPWYRNSSYTHSKAGIVRTG